jgi:hypothetical protein
MRRSSLSLVKEEMPRNEEALIPVVARTCYREMNRGFAVPTSVRLRTGGLECKGYKTLMQEKGSPGEIMEIHVTLFGKFLLGDG